MKTWILFNGVYYNLTVLLRIAVLPDGGYSLQHQNQKIDIPKTVANAAVIAQIGHFLAYHTYAT